MFVQFQRYQFNVGIPGCKPKSKLVRTRTLKLSTHGMNSRHILLVTFRMSTTLLGGGGYIKNSLVGLYLTTIMQHHASQYTTLARIARDYLPIQGSATASERAFSNGSLTATQHRNRLAPDMFEALQLLKSAYRNGYIGAAEEATKRIIAMLDDSDDEA